MSKFLEHSHEILLRLDMGEAVVMLVMRNCLSNQMWVIASPWWQAGRHPVLFSCPRLQNENLNGMLIVTLCVYVLMCGRSVYKFILQARSQLSKIL